MANIEPGGAADKSESEDGSIEDEFLDAESPFTENMRKYQRGFGKQEVFEFGYRKGAPVLDQMRPLECRQSEWLQPKALEGELLNQAKQQKQEANDQIQKEKMQHQQKVRDLLQDIEFKADFIPLMKDKFKEDFKNQETLVEEQKYLKVEKQ